MNAIAPLPNLVPKLKSTTLKQLLEKTFPKREFLLEPIMKQGESLMLWAAPGVGKTMLALSIALAVSGGGELIGLKSAGNRKVLIVDGEMNEADLADRFKALVPAVTGCDREMAAANVTILARQAQALDASFPDLATPAGQQAVLSRAVNGEFDLVILDNFSTLASIEDENSASAMDPVLRFLMMMKQAGIACILVHHSAKGGDKYRGSSKIETTFEVIIGLRKPNITDASDRAAFEIEFTKFRGIRNVATKGKKAWLRERPDKTLEWCFEVAEGETMVEMISMLRTCLYPTQRALAEAVGVSAVSITRLKARAFADGHLSKGEWEEYMKEASSTPSAQAGDDF